MAHRVALANSDEFGRLAADFNEMAAAIEEREQRLAHQALHDPLTGLANRRLFADRLAHALARLARDRRPLAVLFFDVDDFKAVNDRFGHAAGDTLLCAVAQRLETQARASDTVARLGGDEFAVLLEEVAHDDAAAAAERFAAALAEPFTVAAGVELHVAVSIGMAVAASPCPAEELVRTADLAMYTTKTQRKQARAAAGSPGREGKPASVNTV